MQDAVMSTNLISVDDIDELCLWLTVSFRRLGREPFDHSQNHFGSFQIIALTSNDRSVGATVHQGVLCRRLDVFSENKKRDLGFEKSMIRVINFFLL